MPVLAGWLAAAAAHAAFSTTVPVSQQSASSIAVSLFPLALKLDQANLFLTDPQVLFLDSERVGIRVTFQAYDHRPEEGIALSETGLATLSARVSYYRPTRQVLLHEARLEQLDFDRDNATARHFARVLSAAWTEEATDPIRTDLPPHPYLMPFRNNIDDIHYDGRNISLVLAYQ